MQCAHLQYTDRGVLTSVHAQVTKTTVPIEDISNTPEGSLNPFLANPLQQPPQATTHEISTSMCIKPHVQGHLGG